MILPRITQFAGEAFGTDNVRVVYAGQEEDTHYRPNRNIVLVGPIGAGKSSLIDFFCNYFYGVQFDSKYRYKIADECFDNTTPEKAVTKYIFNGTNMPYRPILIDTPGIGDPTGLKANRELASVVTDYFKVNAKERIHAVCLVLPSFMRSVNEQIDSDIRLTLSLFPDWMHENIVPILTFADDTTERNDALLRHFGLATHSKFFVNTQAVFDAPSENSEELRRQRALWDLTSSSARQFLRFVGELRAQTIERRLLSGDATPTSPLSPAAVELGQKAGEKSPQEADRPSFDPPPPPPPLPPPPTHGGVEYRETDVFTAVREETTITEVVPAAPLQHSSPRHSVQNPERLGQEIQAGSGRRLDPIQPSAFPYPPPPPPPPPPLTPFEKKIYEATGKGSPPLGQGASAKPLGQSTGPSFQDELGQRVRESGRFGQSVTEETHQHGGIPLSPTRDSNAPPLVPPHQTAAPFGGDSLRSGGEFGQKAAEMRAADYPAIDDEQSEFSNLELLRRYIYDPSSRTYRVQYVHEVATRESRRSSGRQSLRASESDLRSPRRAEAERRHAAPTGGLDDSFLGTLAEELRRQGDYGNEGRLNRNTSAPHLDTEWDKENARRVGLDYSPHALKKMLGDFGQQTRGNVGQPSPQRPQVIRKPYDQPRAPDVQAARYAPPAAEPVRIPITSSRVGQPLRPANGQQLDRDYADEALRQARAHRSASHAVPADQFAQHSPATPDRSFDEKERMFERNASARQSVHNSSIRRGVRSALRSSRPSGDETSGEEWDHSPTSERRGSGGRFQQPQPQPRTIQPVPLQRSTPPVSGDREQAGGHWTPQPTQQSPQQQRGAQTRGPPRDLEAGAFRPEERRPLNPPPFGRAKTKPQEHEQQRKPPKNRKFPSFTRCCFYIIAPFVIVLIVAGIIITLIVA
ncbi:RNA polymerase II-associated factor 1-like protein [Aphelenchoides fujianensis]|nr:RNA polymerase II-associated factor 1-like protein [Aphelenchoides fujianensis]